MSRYIIASMTFVKTECPECGETVILDVVNGYGYCMYCGAKVEPEGLRRLPSPLRIALMKELRCDDPFLSEPWYGDLCEAVRLMLSGDSDEGAAVIRGIYGSAADDEERAKVSSTLELEVLDAIVSVIDGDGSRPYRGGFLDVIGVMKEFDEAYSPEIINLCLVQMTAGTYVDRDVAKAILISLFYLARDSLVLTRGAAETKEILGHICAIVMDVVVKAYPDVSDVDISEEAAGCFKFLMDLWGTLIAATDEMTQKDYVKVNRILSATGYAEVLTALGEAFFRAKDGEEAYKEPMYRYVSLICGISSQESKKGGKRSKA